MKLALTKRPPSHILKVLPIKIKEVKTLPCYKPMLATPVSISHDTGKVQYRFREKFESAAQLTEVVELEGKLYPVKALPCGKCIGCRLDYSKEWAIRCTLEMQDYDSSECYFVTLTYDDAHLPISFFCPLKDQFDWFRKGGYIHSHSHDDRPSFVWYDENDIDFRGIAAPILISKTLKPDHLTKFVKDLRRSQKYHFDSEFRFYACGEYGTRSARPHYHLIIFGLKHPAIDNDTWKSVRNGSTIFESKYLESVWKKGNVIVGSCSFNSIGYVARYMLKKKKGEFGSFYKTFNLVPEFTRMSRMPGIGSNYYEQYKNAIYENDEIFIKTEKRGIKVKPPLYFDKLAVKEFPDMMEEIKDIRSQAAFESMVAKEFKSGLTMAEILANEEESRKFKTKILQKRSATE